jgi:hypothetical protein
MAKLAKLRLREQRSWRIWESLARYANAPDGRSRAGSNAQEFQGLLSMCMDWIGGVDDDIAECGDLKDGASLSDLEAGYRADVRRVLVWLSAPDQCIGSAVRAARFLRLHGTGIKMAIDANMNFKADADEPLLTEWPDACQSVVAPVCKFILDQIERHDTGGEALRDVVPVGLCERSGCGRFFLIERVGRRRFCGSKCRARVDQDKLTKEQKAARMRKYRATIKELQRKPIRFAKKKIRG